VIDADAGDARYTAIAGCTPCDQENQCPLRLAYFMTAARPSQVMASCQEQRGPLPAPAAPRSMMSPMKVKCSGTGPMNRLARPLPEPLDLLLQQPRARQRLDCRAIDQNAPLPFSLDASQRGDLGNASMRQAPRSHGVGLCRSLKF
jgi:hypothetical protein